MCQQIPPVSCPTGTDKRNILDILKTGGDESVPPAGCPAPAVRHMYSHVPGYTLQITVSVCLLVELRNKPQLLDLG